MTTSLFTLLLDPTAWAALFSLVAMEIALGIDNLLFLTLLTSGLPENQRRRAQFIGLALALVIRLLCLVSMTFMIRLTTPVFSFLDHEFSWRDLVVLAGGVFLVWKATTEIHRRIDPDGRAPSAPTARESSLLAVVVQIPLFDMLFSLDSIITAIGMTDHLAIMIAAVIIAMTAMLIAASPLSTFLQTYPSLIMLALGFLLLIGVTLVAEAFGTRLPRGYIYSAMAFSSFVIVLDILSRRARRLREIRLGTKI